MLGIRIFRKLIALAIIMVLVEFLPPGALAAGGSWSGSTPDNGMGQNVSVEGHWSETTGANGETTYESESTTTWRDNKTGKVIRKTVRKRKKVRGLGIIPLGPNAGIYAYSESSTDEHTVTNNPDGSSTGMDSHQKTGESSEIGGIGGKKKTTYEHSDQTTNYDKPDENGKIVGGHRTVVKREDNTRMQTVGTFLPSTRVWVDKVVSMPAPTKVSLVVPQMAGASAFVEGTVVAETTNEQGIPVQSAAAGGVVLVEQPNGKRVRAVVGGDGKFRVWAAGIAALGRYTFKVFEDPNARSADAQTPVDVRPMGPSLRPQIVDSPTIASTDNQITINGSNFAAPGNPEDPQVLLCTRKAGVSADVLAGSSNQFIVQVPQNMPLGAGTIVVENGRGAFSKPTPINFVAIDVTAPPTVRLGQAFTAGVKLDGLTAENAAHNPSVVLDVAGSATFANGSRETTVSLTGGSGSVQLIARSGGRYVVRVVRILTH